MSTRVAARHRASLFGVGDVVLHGKYKNKRGKIIRFFTDERGVPMLELEPVPKGRKQNKLMGLYNIWQLPDVRLNRKTAESVVGRWLLRHAAYSAEFLGTVNGKHFRHPDTGNQVLFQSLPDAEQAKIHERWEGAERPDKQSPTPKVTDRDFADAIETLNEFFDGGHSLEDFDRSPVRRMTTDEVGRYDDFSSWAEWSKGELRGLSPSERRAELESFRGEDFADRAEKWIEEGRFPPIVLVDSSHATAVADGRGRTSVALGMGMPVDAVVLTDKKQEGESDNATERDIFGESISAERRKGILGAAAKSDRDLEQMPTDELGRLAFGFARGDIREVPLSSLHVAYNTDLKQAELDVGRSPKKWEKFLDEPIQVKLKKGKLQIEDGHHRFVTSKRLGHKTIKAELSIDDKPIPVIRALAESMGKTTIMDKVAHILSSLRVASRYKSKKKVKTKDGDDMVVYEYGPRQVANRNKDKAERIEKLRKQISKLRTKVKRDLASSDEQKRGVALAVALMDATYERPGNEGSADEGHFGVTTWCVKHVKFKGKKAIITYVGKSGVKQSKEVTEAAVVKALRATCKGKEKGDCILGITAADVNEYLEPFEITAKDIRGLHANREMKERLKAIRSKGPKLPEGRKEKDGILKKEFKEALAETAEAVGHTESILRKQYLVPGLEEDFIKDGTVHEKHTKRSSASLLRTAALSGTPLERSLLSAAMHAPVYVARDRAWWLANAPNLYRIARAAENVHPTIEGLVFPTNMFAMLWYENEDGDILPSEPGDVPVGSATQHTRWPNLLRHDILVSNEDGTVSSLGGMDSTFSSDLVTRMVRSGDWDVADAVMVAGQSCERCMNVLCHHYGLADGYPFASEEYWRCGTRCKMCEHHIGDPREPLHGNPLPERVASPRYEDYVQRKQRDGETLLDREDWETKVLGVGQEVPTPSKEEWDTLRQQLHDEHNLDKFHAAYRPENKHLSIDNISVPKAERGKGQAGRAMAKTLGWADAHGITVTLSPTSEFGSSKPKLEQWYRGLGFVPNKGRHKDFRFRETMIRLPKPAKVATRTPAEVEDANVEKMLRKEPKKNPPRYDLRDNRTLEEEDDSKANATNDPDLSLKWNKVGGRVAFRWLAVARMVSPTRVAFWHLAKEEDSEFQQSVAPPKKFSNPDYDPKKPGSKKDVVYTSLSDDEQARLYARWKATHGEDEEDLTEDAVEEEDPLDKAEKILEEDSDLLEEDDDSEELQEEDLEEEEDASEELQDEDLEDDGSEEPQDESEEAQDKEPETQEEWRDKFLGATYGDENGEWHVGDLIHKSLSKEIEEIPTSEIDEALKNLSADESVGSKEFQERAQRADLKYPVLLLRNEDGTLDIIDGSHRAWKAREEGVPLRARIFTPSDLQELDQVSDEDKDLEDDESGEEEQPDSSEGEPYTNDAETPDSDEPASAQTPPAQSPAPQSPAPQSPDPALEKLRDHAETIKSHLVKLKSGIAESRDAIKALEKLAEKASDANKITIAEKVKEEKAKLKKLNSEHEDTTDQLKAAQKKITKIKFDKTPEGIKKKQEEQQKKRKKLLDDTRRSLQTLIGGDAGVPRTTQKQIAKTLQGYDEQQIQDFSDALRERTHELSARDQNLPPEEAMAEAIRDANRVAKIEDFGLVPDPREMAKHLADLSYARTKVADPMNLGGQPVGGREVTDAVSGQRSEQAFNHYRQLHKSLRRHAAQIIEEELNDLEPDSNKAKELNAILTGINTAHVADTGEALPGQPQPSKGHTALVRKLIETGNASHMFKPLKDFFAGESRQAMATALSGMGSAELGSFLFGEGDEHPFSGLRSTLNSPGISEYKQMISDFLIQDFLNDTWGDRAVRDMMQAAGDANAHDPEARAKILGEAKRAAGAQGHEAMAAMDRVTEARAKGQAPDPKDEELARQAFDGENAGVLVNNSRTLLKTLRSKFKKHVVSPALAVLDHFVKNKDAKPLGQETLPHPDEGAGDAEALASDKEHGPGEVWKTQKGNWRAKNKKGAPKTFHDRQEADRYAGHTEAWSANFDTDTPDEDRGPTKFAGVADAWLLRVQRIHPDDPNRPLVVLKAA